MHTERRAVTITVYIDPEQPAPPPAPLWESSFDEPTEALELDEVDDGDVDFDAVPPRPDPWTALGMLPLSQPAADAAEDAAEDASQPDLEDAMALELAQAAADAPAPADAPHVQARILWPALGCPAVVAPRPSPAAGGERTARHQICVLLLSDKERLTSADAAAHLRLVPWAQRTRRQMPAGGPGTFAADDLRVRSDVPAGTLTRPQSDERGDAIAFGGDRHEDRVVVSLARQVKRFYAAQGLRYLHEICIAEQACARLADDQYQLFWNNRAPAEASSDEMTMLIDRFAVGRRRDNARTDKWREFNRRKRSFLIDEYRFDFGALHRPYVTADPQRRRTEVLHPVFIRRQTGPLKMAHITDTHVDTRHDVYEHNLMHASAPMSRDGTKLRYRGRELRFNNWNKSFCATYDDAKANADLVLLTGDIIDFGRGHVGLVENGAHRHDLAADDAYQVDRNWFLFYYLLASGARYTKPVYTSLGNHDWRLNPYPPFAPGAPNPKELIHNHRDFAQDGELREIIRIAHGPGSDPAIPMYAQPDVRGALGGLLNLLVTAPGLLDVPDSPIQTTAESVAWYLLLINPFLDYALPFPGGQQLLMLDWGEDEEIIDPDWMRRGTPRAKNALSSLQRWHVSEFVRSPGRAKVIGLHMPPLGPSWRWNDADLERGEVTYPAPVRMRRDAGTVAEVRRHTLYAVAPRGAPAGVAAAHGSLVHGRPWLLDQIATPTSGVRVIVSGHIHRDGLFQAPPASGGNGRLLRRVDPVSGGRAFGSPLYVNTASAGPRGSHVHAGGEEFVPPRFNVVTLTGDGLITGVQQRQLREPSQRQPSAAARPAPRAATHSRTR